MRLTLQQEDALRHWDAGHNVCVQAVPGAGKSCVLTAACARLPRDAGSILLVAYNRRLAEDTRERLRRDGLRDAVVCMTFHALAQRCMSCPVSDDIALHEAVESAEAGTLPVQPLEAVRYVLIDEAQDFKHIFMRLLRVVCDLRRVRRYLVVGDPRQMLYDYDAEDPADLRFLTEAGAYFCNDNTWRQCALDETHRLTPAMCLLVGHMFGGRMCSAKRDEEPVHVHTLDLWLAGPVVFEALKALARPNLAAKILVARKKNNAQLRALVNWLSARGVRIHIHGVDSRAQGATDNKVCVSSWHASKGTQAELVILFGLGENSNAAFVACSRASQRLVVIQDKMCVNPALMTALRAMAPHTRVLDAATERLLFVPHDPPSPPASPEHAPDQLCLDTWQPAGSGRRFVPMRAVTASTTADTRADTSADADGTCEEVQPIYLIAALMRFEYEQTGRVRRLDDIELPIRLSKEKQAVAIANGGHGRYVSTHATEASLVGTPATVDIRRYVQPVSKLVPIDWCTLACAAHAWNSYHHSVRQMQPLDWFDGAAFEHASRVLRGVLGEAPTGLRFDVRQKVTLDDGTLCHARCHMAVDEYACWIVWDEALSHTHRFDATVAAALHPKGDAKLCNLRTGEVESVHVDDPSTVLRACLDEAAA